MLKIQNSRCIKLPSTFYTVEYQIYTQYLQTILRTFQGTYIQDLYSGGIYVEGKMYQYLRMTTFYLFDLLLGGLYWGEAYFRGAYIQEFTVYGSAAYQELLRLNSWDTDSPKNDQNQTQLWHCRNIFQTYHSNRGHEINIKG